MLVHPVASISTPLKTIIGRRGGTARTGPGEASIGPQERKAQHLLIYGVAGGWYMSQAWRVRA